MTSFISKGMGQLVGHMNSKTLSVPNTTEGRAILKDWFLDFGIEIYFRSRLENGWGNGFGQGAGAGDGSGYLDGSGYGEGWGTGFEDQILDGRGNGNGTGFERGSGNGYGAGDGFGYWI